MQDLIIYNRNQVILQSNEKIYQDTQANFLQDYGQKIDYVEIDYNRETRGCCLNGEALQQYPNKLCEDILNNIDILLTKKAEREKPPEPTLDELKSQKLQEVDSWTATKITGGFVSECSGERVRYDSDKDTQLTMQGIALNVDTALFTEKYPNGCPVRGYAEGANTKSVFMLTPEQVMRWQADLSIHIGSCKQAGWQKQAEVQAATSKEDLEAIILE